jgi:hypothetical protein
MQCDYPVLNLSRYGHGMDTEKKSEFMGQFRIKPSEKARIREMLTFYGTDRDTMARAVMNALFRHYARQDQLEEPLRFVTKHDNHRQTV